MNFTNFAKFESYLISCLVQLLRIAFDKFFRFTYDFIYLSFSILAIPQFNFFLTVVVLPSP